MLFIEKSLTAFSLFLINAFDLKWQFVNCWWWLAVKILLINSTNQFFDKLSRSTSKYFQVVCCIQEKWLICGWTGNSSLERKSKKVFFRFFSCDRIFEKTVALFFSFGDWKKCKRILIVLVQIQAQKFNGAVGLFIKIRYSN